MHLYTFLFLLKSFKNNFVFKLTKLKKKYHFLYFDISKGNNSYTSSFGEVNGEKLYTDFKTRVLVCLMSIKSNNI